ncbi:phosphotransferase enzyme family protein [Pseudactinotalea suaedae]|uniref:phosphotransferase enzyme family protein n=1 Tax=Pseudactinotalea suaedae TaxID=1524924 RepID=UPI0012E10C35|nr:phosphotransferase [Pseudactinotalea suaedae]
MFAPGLAMLWEPTDPTTALVERFGLADLDSATRWLSAALLSGWGLRAAGVERILISDVNALAWVHTEDATVVVKVSSFVPGFARLDDIAALVGDLEADGLPVAAPLPALDGRRRRVVESDRPLSVAVHPMIDGDLLDVDDVTAVGATGEVVGRLHVALAAVDPAPFGHGPREITGDLREHIASGRESLPEARAPRACARLGDLLETLPDLDVPPQLGHGDVRGANVLVRDHQVAALLDFDEVSVRHRTAEVSLGAVLLATEFRRWPPAPLAAQRAFLDGYGGVVPLTDAEHGWSEALRLWFGLTQIPAGDDPAGWAAAVEQSV